MRSKIAAVLVGGAFLLGGTLPAMANAAEHQLSGKLSRLDAKAGTLAVTPEGTGTSARDTSFTLAPGAKIMNGAKATSLGELAVGERVKVSYSTEGSKHQAKRIELLPARTATAPSSKHMMSTKN